MGNSSKSNAFIVCYEVSNKNIGGANLRLTLMVDPETRKVTGFGVLSKSVEPPAELRTELTGIYRSLEVGPDGRWVTQVFATGQNPGAFPLNPFQPLIYQNFELWLTLDEKWGDGSAAFSYQASPDAPWELVETLPARRIDCFQAAD